MSASAVILKSIVDNLIAVTEQFHVDSIGAYYELLNIGLSIALILAFLGMMLGKTNKKLLFSCCWASLAWALVSQFNVYYDWCCLPFYQLSTKASCFAFKTISGGDITTITGAFEELDKIGEKLFDSLTALSPEAGMLGMLKTSIHTLKLEMGLAVISILYVATYAIFFAIFASTLVMQFILFMVGPLLILALVFPATRHLGFNWIKAQFTFSITCLFASIFMAMNLWLFDEIATSFQLLKVGDDIFTTEYFAFVAMGALAIYLLLKAPTISSSLTGGQADNTSGLGISVMAMGGAAAGGLAKFSPTKETAKNISSLGGKALDHVSNAWRGSGSKPTR